MVDGFDSSLGTLLAPLRALQSECVDAYQAHDTRP